MPTRQARQNWLKESSDGFFSRKDLLDIILSFSRFPQDPQSLGELNQLLNLVANEFESGEWPGDTGVQLSSFQQIRTIMGFLRVDEVDEGRRNFIDTPVKQGEFNHLKKRIRRLYNQAGLQQTKQHGWSFSGGGSPGSQGSGSPGSQGSGSPGFQGGGSPGSQGGGSPGPQVTDDVYSGAASPQRVTEAEMYASTLNTPENPTFQKAIEEIPEGQAKDYIKLTLEAFKVEEDQFEKDKIERRQRAKNLVKTLIGNYRRRHPEEDEQKGSPFAGGGGTQGLHSVFTSTLRF